VNTQASIARLTTCVSSLMTIAPLLAALALYFIQSAAAADDYPARILASAIEHDRVLTQSEYLSLLVSPRPLERRLIFRALTKSDPRTRRVAALQLGELKEVDTSVVAQLVQAVKDPDQGVAEQAMVSLIRLGGTARALLLPLIKQTTPLHDFVYRSTSANQRLRRGITASDLAIAGLYYGHDVDLEAFVDAYLNAVRTESAAAPVAGLPEGYSVGSSVYFANALAALLQRSPDAHVELINRLLGVDDPQLRYIAYESAAKVTTADPKLTVRLAAVVRDSKNPEDRTRAADSLAENSSDGRDQLFQLSHHGNADIRAAALAPLLKGADCSSPFLALAVEDTDITVRKTALKSILTWPVYMPCLAPLLTDDSLDQELREGIIFALHPRDQDEQKKVSDRELQDLSGFFVRSSRTRNRNCTSKRGAPSEACLQGANLAKLALLISREIGCHPE
jgi:hypothetical protein